MKKMELIDWGKTPVMTVAEMDAMAEAATAAMQADDGKSPQEKLDIGLPAWFTLLQHQGRMLFFVERNERYFAVMRAEESVAAAQAMLTDAHRAVKAAKAELEGFRWEDEYSKDYEEFLSAYGDELERAT